MCVHSWSFCRSHWCHDIPFQHSAEIVVSMTSFEFFEWFNRKSRADLSQQQIGLSDSRNYFTIRAVFFLNAEKLWTLYVHCVKTTKNRPKTMRNTSFEWLKILKEYRHWMWKEPSRHVLSLFPFPFTGLSCKEKGLVRKDEGTPSEFSTTEHDVDAYGACAMKLIQTASQISPK